MRPLDIKAEIADNGNLSEETALELLEIAISLQETVEELQSQLSYEHTNNSGGRPRRSWGDW